MESGDGIMVEASQRGGSGVCCTRVFFLPNPSQCRRGAKIERMYLGYLNSLQKFEPNKERL